MATWTLQEARGDETPALANDAVQQLIETYIGYKLSHNTEQYVAYVLNCDAQFLLLPRLPVVSVDSYTYEGREQSTAEVKGYGYRLSRIDLKDFPVGRHIFEMQAGYTPATVPDGIATAARLLQTKLDGGTQPKEFDYDGVKTQYFDDFGQLLTLDIKQLLSPYKMVQL